MTTETRLEADSIGTMEVPAEAYYGVQALRAKQNFPITGTKLHPVFIRNLAQIKKAAAITNNNAGLLPEDKADAIVRACDEVIAGKLAEEFIVDAIQGGAGTSANMNMNEVIANRAGEILGCPKGSYKMVHPNDHVNMAQSTNDVIPTAGKLTVLDLLAPLEKALVRLEKELAKKAEEFDDVITMGRTQLQDAVPIRLGQVFHGYASMVSRDRKRIEKAHREMYTVNLGGTAVGTAINVSDSYFYKIVPNLEKLTGYPLKQAEDLFDATENLDGFVAVSGVVKTCAVDLSKMCNDLRLMSSGPKTGFGEINLPAKQNGSSIMPGKVNPTQCEAMTMVAVQVMGNDAAIGFAASQGNFELNVFMPVIAYNFLQSVRLLSDVIVSFNDNCAVGIKANREKMKHNLHNSLMLVTALNPYIGYDNAAKTSKKAYKENISLKEACVQLGFLTAEKFDEVFHPEEMA